MLLIFGRQWSLLSIRHAYLVKTVPPATSSAQSCRNIEQLFESKRRYRRREATGWPLWPAELSLGSALGPTSVPCDAKLLLMVARCDKDVNYDCDMNGRGLEGDRP